MGDKKKVVFPSLIDVSGESIPEAWENAYLALADKGLVYTRLDPEDSSFF